MVDITFVYSIDDEDYWRDGLWAALRVLDKKYDIDRRNIRLGEKLPQIDSEYILVWGALNSWQVAEVAKLPIPKGICVAGGPVVHPVVHDYDDVYVETRWHAREFRRIGTKTMLAFGTNTDLFNPIEGQQKIFRAIYPAAFAKWKRHNIFARKYKKQGLAVGYMQPGGVEPECLGVCVENHVAVLPRVTPEVLVWLYNMSRRVHITADLWGGGERAVLEGLACGIDVEVEQDNPKLLELLEEQRKSLDTHNDYACALNNGIERRIRT